MSQAVADIRQTIKAQRAALSIDKVQSDSRLACDRLIIHPCFKRWQHIGGYLAHQTELQLDSFIQYCWQQEKYVYAPKIGAKESLQFSLYSPQADLIKNQFGILEPSSPTVYPVQELDVLIVPGVVFDKSGNRVGMGKGYYDRLLEYKTMTPYIKPYLIGIGYDFQLIDSLQPETWDIPMNEVITP